jgi:D-alanyl-D-alanine carboxypeptidase
MRHKSVATRRLLVLAVAFLVLVGGSISDAGAHPRSGTTARGPSAARLTAAIRSVRTRYHYRAQIFGVWHAGRAVLVGADGSSQDGVPARADMHFWAGNTMESMLATAFYRLAERGKVSLNAPLSRWYPKLPNASKVTLKMLADSVSGYNDYVTTDSFQTNYGSNPFRIWRVPELLRIAFSVKKPLFAPGKSWKFSDTNYLLLGSVLGRITHGPPERAIQRLVVDPLHLRSTRLTRLGLPLSPTLHSYTSGRGFYEDVTFWSTSPFQGAGDINTTVSDVAVWARARALGTLLSPASRRAFFSNKTAGLGPFTTKRYYANATINNAGWVMSTPDVNGTSGMVAHHIPTDTTVVIFATTNPKSDEGIRYAQLAFLRVAKMLTPRNVPILNPCPRGC